MTKTYREWVHWLENRSIMPLVKPGLDNTRKALTEAGILALVDPQKVIHVAGTNGKGTTSKTLAELLRSEGKSVGLYTSPHLVDTCERISIHGENISQKDFCELCETYSPLIEKLHLSHFESLTLFAAVMFFKKKPVDYAIFEIGLGGTWDATNAIPHATSVITAIGYDHQHILGNTLEEIADNKFGIIQEGNLVVHLPYPPNLQIRLSERIGALHAKEVVALAPEFSVEIENQTPRYVLHTLQGKAPLSLMGQRAAENMSLALKVFEELGFNTQKALPVLNKISWPARMTQVSSNLPSPVYLSGDHNIQGIESLCEIVSHFPYKSVHFILGLSKNRSHKEFLEKLSAVRNSRIYLTQPQFQGVPPTDSELPFYKTPYEALDSLKNKVAPEDLVVVTGSLYLCGDVMRFNE